MTMKMHKEHIEEWNRQDAFNCGFHLATEERDSEVLRITTVAMRHRPGFREGFEAGAGT